MLEKEYLISLEKIRKLIRRGLVEKTLPMMEELFHFKPVRLKWFVVKAEILAALGKWEEGAALLYDRYWPYYEEKEANAYFDWHRRWRNYENDTVGEEAYRFVQCMVNQRDHLISDPFLSQVEQERVECEQKFLQNPDDKEVCIALANVYYKTNRAIEFILLSQLCKNCWRDDAKSRIPEVPLFSYILKNSRFLSEQLLVAENSFIVIAEIDEDIQTAQVLSCLLSAFGHRVFLVLPPVLSEISNDISMQDIVRISIENIEDYDVFQVIRPIQLVRDEVVIDNRVGVLEYITKQSGNDFTLVLSPSMLWNKLLVEPQLKQRLERLTEQDANLFDRYFHFGYMGSYVSYVQQIHGVNIMSELSAPSSCAISIIVPARNSAHTLQHTLQTCLEQRFDDYEIVVSDNSSEGNLEVYNLVKRLAHPKIKYYKTPRELNLVRSFEFAYLKARGEFVFSIGSDDAVLPWGLDTIHRMLKQYPDEDLLCWDRGFYIWPKFTNTIQLGQFIIPRAYQKDVYNPGFYAGEKIIEQLLQSPEVMYSVPMLYINSGCRRQYLKKILKTTGKLWNGVSQDLYMGAINLAMNSKYLQIHYPITIAGMSSSSIGAICGSGVLSVRDFRASGSTLSRDVGTYSLIPLERPFLTVTGSDRAGMYCSILRAISYGIISEDIIEKFDLKLMFEKILSQLNLNDLNYDRIVSFTRYQSRFIGEEFSRYFDTTVYPSMLMPRTVSKVPEDIIAYSEGFNDSGQLVLDARKFNVTNIAEAVKLFSNITNL